MENVIVIDEAIVRAMVEAHDAGLTFEQFMEMVNVAHEQFMEMANVAHEQFMEMVNVAHEQYAILPE